MKILTLDALHHDYRDRILAIAERRGVKDLRVFGSFARGDQTEKSDIDFLFTRLPETDLMDIGGLKWELEDLLERQVDLVSDTSISPFMQTRILKEAVPL